MRELEAFRIMIISNDGKSRNSVMIDGNPFGKANCFARILLRLYEKEK